MEKRAGRFIIGIFLVCLFLVEFTGASFAVTSLYSTNVPLRMYRGEVRDIPIIVQNVISGGEDLKVKAEIISGHEVANLVNRDLEYDVPFGQEANVNVRIEIPENAFPEEKYKVTVLFKPVPSEGQENNIQFLTNIGKSIPVIVLSDEDEKTILEEKVEASLGFEPSRSTGKEGIWAFIIIFLVVLIISIAVALVILVLISSSRSKGVSSIINESFPGRNPENSVYVTR